MAGSVAIGRWRGKFGNRVRWRDGNPCHFAPEKHAQSAILAYLVRAFPEDVDFTDTQT